MRLPKHPQPRRDRVDVRFDTHNRHLGLCPPERTAKRRKSVSSRGTAIWCHAVSHIGSGGYSEMGNCRVEASEEVAESDAKVYAQVHIHRCLQKLNKT